MELHYRQISDSNKSLCALTASFARLNLFYKAAKTLMNINVPEQFHFCKSSANRTNKFPLRAKAVIRPSSLSFLSWPLGCLITPVLIIVAADFEGNYSYSCLHCICRDCNNRCRLSWINVPPFFSLLPFRSAFSHCLTELAVLHDSWCRISLVNFRKGIPLSNSKGRKLNPRNRFHTTRSIPKLHPPPSLSPPVTTSPTFFLCHEAKTIPESRANTSGSRTHCLSGVMGVKTAHHSSGLSAGCSSFLATLQPVRNARKDRPSP